MEQSVTEVDLTLAAKDKPALSPNTRLLGMLPFSTSERDRLNFDTNGYARLERRESDPDSHGYIIQITLGGAGLRMEAKSDKSGLTAWRQDLREETDGTTVTEEVIEPHFTSRRTDMDEHIKLPQRRAEDRMRLASGEFKGLDEYTDPFYSELVDKVRSGEDKSQWDLHGYNAELISSKTISKPGQATQIEMAVTQKILDRKDATTLNYTNHIFRANFADGKAVAGTFSHNTNPIQIKR